MKAIITAGGRGTRLQPLTHTQNKHLLPIANQPMLFYALDSIASTEIKEVLLNINAGDKEVPALVGDGKKWGLKITYQEQNEPKGLGHLLQLAQPFIGKQKFVFYYGDNIFTGDLNYFLTQWQQAKTNFHLCLAEVPDPERFGVAVVEADRVTKTVEKPPDFISNLAITGIQFYDQSIFEALKHTKPTPPRGKRKIAEMDIPPANQWLIDHGYTASYSVIDGWWKDTGKPETLLEANRLVLSKIKRRLAGQCPGSTIDGAVIIPKTTVVKNSVIRGPVVLGENVYLENAYLGPYTAVMPGTKIVRAEIENSIILGEVQIENIAARMDSNIIGWNAQVVGACHCPKVITLQIGDNSYVEICS